jgi:hypothetical protein
MGDAALRWVSLRLTTRVAARLLVATQHFLDACEVERYIRIFVVGASSKRDHTQRRLKLKCVARDDGADWFSFDGRQRHHDGLTLDGIRERGTHGAATSAYNIRARLIRFEHGRHDVVGGVVAMHPRADNGLMR